MKFSINQIRLQSYDQPFTFDETVDVSILKSSNNDIRKIDFVQVKGICSIDKNELIFSYTIKGKIVLPCARTLVDVDYPMQFNVTDVFTTASVLTEEDVENDVHQIIGDELDLLPYIRENILLELPFRVFSDEKPIEKGKGWQYFSEDTFERSKKDKIDPRFEKLKKLLNNDNDETK